MARSSLVLLLCGTLVFLEAAAPRQRASLLSKQAFTSDEACEGSNKDLCTVVMGNRTIYSVPFDRLAQLFNVNTFVVSQVNPHVVPFLADAAYDYLLAGAGGAGSLLSQASNPAPRGKGTLLHRVEEELRHDVSVSVTILAKN